LVEDCQRVSISTFARKAREKLRKELMAAEVKLADLSLELTSSKTAFDGTRYWFQCPVCRRRSGTLYVHPLTSAIGCRKCLGVEYRSRRYKGMIEASTSNSRRRGSQQATKGVLE
jgi:hypothetical protein